jgi:hypothetical protein
VVLSREDWDRWLDVEHCYAEAAQKILEHTSSSGWKIYPVSRAVNSPANDDPSLIEPAGPQNEAADAPPRAAKSRLKKEGSGAGNLFEM